MGEKEQYEKLQQFIAAYDWEGLARSWQESNVQWHAKEWKEFVAEVQKTAIADVLKEVEEANDPTSAMRKFRVDDTIKAIRTKYGIGQDLHTSSMTSDGKDE